MRAIAFLLFAAILALGAPDALAVEFKPYPSEAISAAQWQDYFDQVTAAYGPSMKELRDDQLVVFYDSATATSYAFTVPGHPAHPAWITRRIVVDNDGWTHVQQIGYFAGKEAPFALLFQQYQETNNRMIDEIKREKGGQ